MKVSLHEQFTLILYHRILVRNKKSLILGLFLQLDEAACMGYHVMFHAEHRSDTGPAPR